MENQNIPYFSCKVVQKGNEVFIPIPYGALENMCRALLANNPDTNVVVCSIDMMKL